MKQTLSPSSISLFLECRRCFWLDLVKGIKRPAGIFPSLPSGMDGILKAHFDTHRQKGEHPEELKGFDVKLFPDIKKLEEWRNNRKGLRFEDNGFTLMGAIDDMLVTADGKYAPLDFKTRGYPKKDDTHSFYQHQMDIYSFLLDKNGLSPAGFAILVFYHPVGVSCCNTKGHHDVLFEPEPVKVAADPARGEKLFREAVECLKGEEPNNKCPWCEGK